MKPIVAAVALGLVACGGAPPAQTAVQSQSGSLSAFAPNTAVFNDENAHKVLLSADAEMCDELVTTGGDRSVVIGPDGGEEPSLFLEMNDEHFWNDETRTIGDDLTADFDPGDFCLDGDGGCLPGPRTQATAGTAQLDRADGNGSGNIVAGTFDLQFPDGGAISGTFNAQFCGALHSGCGSAGGGLGGLLALGLITLRRRRDSRRRREP